MLNYSFQGYIEQSESKISQINKQNNSKDNTEQHWNQKILLEIVKG